MGVYANSALAPDLWCVCARGAGGGQGGAAAKAGVGARTHAHTPAINRARAHTVSQTPDFTPPPSRRLARRDSRRRFWPTRPAGSAPSPRRASTTSSRPPPQPPEPVTPGAGRDCRRRCGRPGPRGRRLCGSEAAPSPHDAAPPPPPHDAVVACATVPGPALRGSLASASTTALSRAHTHTTQHDRRGRRRQCGLTYGSRRRRRRSGSN